MIRWAKGGEADIVALDDDRVTLASTRPSPPGSCLEGTLNAGTTLRIKVRGCKRDGERFRIDGRILDLSKSLRQELHALVAAT